MKRSILLQIFSDAFKGFKMMYLSCRRDHYGYLIKYHKLYLQFGGLNRMYIYEHCGLNGGIKFLCNQGIFILKRNCSVGYGLTVITANHQYDKVGQIPESNDWGNQYSMMPL